MKSGLIARGLGLTILVSLFPFVDGPSIASADNSLTASCVSGTCTVTATDTTTASIFTIPYGVTSISFTIKGGRGGQGQSNSSLAAGAQFDGILAVSPGDILTIYPGAIGKKGDGTTGSYTFSGGRNSGGYSAGVPDFSGGSGGGATEVLRNSTSVLVAGGGGGAGGWSGGAGGKAGTTTFTSGVSAGLGGAASQINTGGASGGSTAGGSAGAKNGTGVNGTSGSAGLGGLGGSGVISGGGGGGGYFGGGGGGGDSDVNGNPDAGGGGGGSSYYRTTMVSSVLAFANGNTGSGSFTFTYTSYTSYISISLPGGATYVQKGISINITAAVDQPGSITFYADGKRIPKCIKLSASIGNKTCAWKPAVQKSVVITATLTPTNLSYVPSSATLVTSAVKRTNNR